MGLKMSTIFDRFGTSWKAASRDVVLIVLGILIAFSLDAWWEDREELDRLQGNLVALKGEFERVVEIIDNDSTHVANSLEATRTLLALTGPGPQENGSDSLEAILDIATMTKTLDLPSGALNSMILSAEVSQIESDRLRSLLARWPALVDEVREQLTFMRWDQDEKVKPLVNRYVPLRNVLRTPLARVGRSAFESDFGGLLRDRGFEGLLADRVQLGVTAEGEFSTLRKAAEDILELIDLELR